MGDVWRCVQHVGWCTKKPRCRCLACGTPGDHQRACGRPCMCQICIASVESAASNVSPHWCGLRAVSVSMKTFSVNPPAFCDLSFEVKDDSEKLLRWNVWGSSKKRPQGRRQDAALRVLHSFRWMVRSDNSKRSELLIPVITGVHRRLQLLPNYNSHHAAGVVGELSADPEQQIKL